MKKLFLFIILITLFSPDSWLNGQTPDTFEPIEFRKKKMFYKGEKIKKAKTLEKIIYPLNDPIANDLLDSYKTTRIVSVVPLAAIAGFYISAIHTAITCEHETLPELDYCSDKFYGKMFTGMGLLVIYAAIGGAGDLKKGKKAVRRYNEVIQEKKDFSGLSLQVIPASDGLGVGIGLKF
ncbi:MAG TPA: hypothetical protein ENJ95_06870 [Bacteroidetes bacterium]|nr:hypothetical protein [Bacteroidota bacterium]